MTKGLEVKKAEAEYLSKLQRLGCIVCRARADKLGIPYEAPDPSLQLTVIHHPREGQGGAQRAQNWLAIPLCEPHHTGRQGVHQNGNKVITPIRLDEMDMLALTIEAFHATYG